MILLFLASFVLILIVIGYDISLRFLKKHPIDKKSSTPEISVIIPTFNEEKNIVKKLNNLFGCDYPKRKMKVYVVDSSTDKTPELAKKFPIKLIRCNKRGKILAINKGLRECKTDIVILTDADITLRKDSLKQIIKKLHGKVGAVSGLVVSREPKLFFGKSKKEYQIRDWKIRWREGLVDTCCSLDGKFIAFRKSLLRKIPEDAFTDDFEMTFLLRKMGYRCVVAKDSIVYEIPPSSLKNEINRASRMIGLSILTTFRHVEMFFNPKYGWFGCLIFPFRRFLNFFLPLILLFIFVYIFIFYNYMLVYLFLLTAGIFLLALKHTLYYSILLIALLKAWVDILIGKFERGAIWSKSA